MRAVIAMAGFVVIVAIQSDAPVIESVGVAAGLGAALAAAGLLVLRAAITRRGSLYRRS